MRRRRVTVVQIVPRGRLVVERGPMLSSPQSRVQTVCLRQQIPVCASLGDRSAIQHENLVGVDDCRQSMSDDDGCSVRHRTLQCAHYFLQCPQQITDILVLKLISVLVFILFSSQNFYFYLVLVFFYQ